MILLFTNIYNNTKIYEKIKKTQSTIFLTMIVLNPAPFAVMYTFGNIFGITSTFFLVGPLKQIKNMCNPNRLIATIVFLASMGMTLFSALYLKSAILVILFVIIQFLALFWYTLSYIPGGRSCFKSCCKNAVTI